MQNNRILCKTAGQLPLKLTIQYCIILMQQEAERVLRRIQHCSVVTQLNVFATYRLLQNRKMSKTYTVIENKLSNIDDIPITCDVYFSESKSMSGD